MKNKENLLADNRKARHNYEFLETIEAGIVLAGWEVKAIMGKQLSINDAYVKIIKNEAFIVGSNIFVSGERVSGFSDSDPQRFRKLLLHRKQIDKLNTMVKADGLTIVPTRVVYRNRKIKIDIAVVRGKNEYDKRQTKKDQDLKLEINRTIKSQKMLD